MPARPAKLSLGGSGYCWWAASMRMPSIGCRLLGLYAMLHAGMLAYDLRNPNVWLVADRAGERIRRIAAMASQGSFWSQLSYAGRHNVPGDYIPQAILYALGGRDLLLLVQVALCLLSVVCVYRIAFIVLERANRALVAAGLYALLPQTLVFPHQLSAEAWFVPFTVFGFYFAARWLSLGEPAAALRSGLSWAWASLTRPTPLPFALLTGALFSRRVSRSALASFLLALLVPFGAWVLLVHASTGYWSLEEGTGTTLGRNLLQRMTFITQSLPPAERGEAREQYIEPALRPGDRGVSVAGYLRFCGKYSGPCASHLEHDAFNFFVKSGIEKLTIDYLGLVPAQDRQQIDASTPNALSGWQKQFRDHGLLAALRFYFARYPLVATLSVLGALGFSIVLLLYLAGAVHVLVGCFRRRSTAAEDILSILLVAYPLYLFVASSAAGFMESRYRAGAEFAIAIVAVRGWQAVAAESLAGALGHVALARRIKLRKAPPAVDSAP